MQLNVVLQTGVAPHAQQHPWHDMAAWKLLLALTSLLVHASDLTSDSSVMCSIVRQV